MSRYALFAALLLFPAAWAASDSGVWAGMRYRMVGPERGGRVTAIAGVTSQPLVYYMGSTGGGIWKTVDAGHNWINVSDGQISVGSMGAIEVAPSDPNIVYAGTGSSKIRSNVSIGRGIYKSTDAGKTWKFIGLRDVGQISAVRIHPSNPDIVLVAALGNPFARNVERGVFRSNDGGKNWKKVLFVTDDVGAADLELQPSQPNVVYACMWHGMRRPWTIISGAREGGIYKSTDGGDTWSKLAGGLPHELFGRSNVAISSANPARVYALIEAKPGSGLYRSEDGGGSWKLINGAGSLITRPFYYTTLGVDPKDPDTVWVGNEGWFKSTDGGASFKRSPVPHGDNHDVWINPEHPEYMIQANDGGANVSIDGGRTWSTQANQPTAEIYQVAVDDQYPYRLYGAQQDNTTVIVPSLSLGNGQNFRVGPGCETGPVIPDVKHPELVYGSCKGQFSILNLTTTNEKQYWVGAQSLYGNPGDALTYRFQRVSPMEVSPYDTRVVYYGSQHVHRTRDGGVTWERISPDLTARPPGTQEASGEPITRDATGEEVYSTLYAIRESRVQKGVIWAGSNDGPVHVSRDDGKTWTNVTPAGLPPGGRVQNIEPSPHRAGSAYLAIYRYLLGDFAPYIYRTDDFGKSWTRLTDGRNGIAADEPTRVVREDPDRAGLLYAGTEFGMYVSFDNGGAWQKFQLNLPATPITDIQVAHQDLILSTQGRGFWILDDVTPLHQVGAGGMPPSILFKPRDAVRTAGRGGRGGLVQFPMPGALLTYSLAASSEVTLEILDAAGKTVRKFTSSGGAAERPAEADAGGDDDEGPRVRSGPTRLDNNPGLHRFTWDLRYPGAWTSATRPEGPNGPLAVPGKYSVRFSAGGASTTVPLTIVEDPRVAAEGVSAADLQAQFEHNMRVRDLVGEANRTVARVREAQTKLRESGPKDKLEEVNRIASRLITPSIRYSKPELLTHIQYLYSMTNMADQKVGQDAVDRYRELRRELDQWIAELDQALGPKN